MLEDLFHQVSALYWLLNSSKIKTLYRGTSRTHPCCITTPTNLLPRTTPRPVHFWPPTVTAPSSRASGRHTWPPTVPTPSSSASGRHIGDWGVRAGARESPGQPLGRLPSQGPPGAWSPMRPPCGGPGPLAARLPAYGIHWGSEGRRGNRRI